MAKQALRRDREALFALRLLGLYDVSEQHPFRTRHLPFSSSNRSASFSQCNGQCLECALGAMVIVVTIFAIHVQGDARPLRERLQAMWQHLCRKIANLLPLQTQIDDGEGAVGKIDDRLRERFVQRAHGVPESRQAGRCVEGLLERLTEGDEGVFRRVMVVNVQVASCPEVQTPAAVFGESVQHVIEKADAGVDAYLLGF